MLNQLIARKTSAKTRSGLTRNGLTIISVIAIPVDGSFFETELGFQIVDSKNSARIVSESSLVKLAI